MQGYGVSASLVPLLVVTEPSAAVSHPAQRPYKHYTGRVQLVELCAFIGHQIAALTSVLGFRVSGLGFRV
jgi:hypothetical protein